ncbi:MAG: nucleoside hydrolase [Prolixibacteraceae bacterium]
MKNLIFILIIFFFTFSGINASEPVKIIFDTDMGPDFDDVGAITILHALATNGECEILATMASDGYPFIGPTLEVFNRYFQKPDIPIGVPDAEAPAFSCPNHWNDSLVINYLPKVKTNKDYPFATDVYRKVLAAQADQSVVIVTVGFLSNLATLLKSAPDQYSSLSGKELVAKKVKKWVAMAGGFPEGNEFNINQHARASEYVIANWPTPVLFSGFEIGAKIMTGNKVATQGTKGSPVQWAYEYCLSNYENKKSVNRNSWDHTAVLCAVRDPEKYFYVLRNGTFVCHPDGSNLWDPDQNSNHSFLVHKYPYQKIADILDDLMLFEPKRP